MSAGPIDHDVLFHKDHAIPCAVGTPNAWVYATKTGDVYQPNTGFDSKLGWFHTGNGWKWPKCLGDLSIYSSTPDCCRPLLVRKEVTIPAVGGKFSTWVWLKNKCPSRPTNGWSCLASNQPISRNLNVEPIQTRMGQVLRYSEIQWLQILKMTSQFVVFFRLLFVLVEIAIFWIIAWIPMFWSSVFYRFLGETPSWPQLDSKVIQGAPSEGPSCSVGGRPRGPHPSDTAGPTGPRWRRTCWVVLVEDFLC